MARAWGERWASLDGLQGCGAGFVAVIVVVIVVLWRDIFTIADFVVATNAIGLTFLDGMRFIAGAHIGLTALAEDGNVARIVNCDAAEIGRGDVGCYADVVGNDDDIFLCAGSGVENSAAVQFNDSAVWRMVNVHRGRGLEFERERSDANEQIAVVAGRKIVSGVDSGAFSEWGVADESILSLHDDSQRGRRCLLLRACDRGGKTNCSDQ